MVMLYVFLTLAPRSLSYHYSVRSWLLWQKEDLTLELMAVVNSLAKTSHMGSK